MAKYAKLATASVPQTEKLNERQVVNNSGGFVFQLDDWARLERWLVIGSDSNTYYQKAKDLTRENAHCVERCYTADPVRTVNTIVNISLQGRAPKNDPAIFALALGACSSVDIARQVALNSLPQVCRTGTHLFQFVDTVRALGRGWGRGLKRAVANWYESRSPEALGYQMIKYRQREGYTHKRLLQTSHPAGTTPMHAELYKWACGKEVSLGALPNQVLAHIQAMASKDKADWAFLVRENNLPWEALPTEANAVPEIWQALLPKMGVTALIRNLGNMSRLGVISPLSKWEKIAVERIRDKDELKKSRAHPFTLLQANRVYGAGRGFRSANSWPVSAPVVEALEAAFYDSFQYVEPTGKRTLIGLDVSGSMSSPFNDSPLTVAEAAAAMLMTVVRTEPWHLVMGFSSSFRDLGIKATDSLEVVLKKTRDNNFGSTDCSVPMLYALHKHLEVDTFQIYTDNETYLGAIHPVQALQGYRRASGINSKLVVVGMTSTGFTIADSNDVGTLDCVGFDSNTPAIIGEFARK